MRAQLFITRFAILLAAISIVTPGNARKDSNSGADRPELHDELIHSDVPLYGYEDDLIPQHFSDDDGSFGCMSRVAMGDWTIRRHDAEDDEPKWLRLSNYGVFHCAFVERGPSDRDMLDAGGYRYSFFVQIGKTHAAGKPVELWVLQSGMQPGSDYLLLARAPSDGLIESFHVLQRRCSAANRREGPAMDVWGTGYCSINSRRNLIAMANAMAKEPPLAKLTFIASAAVETDADEPTE